MEAAIDSSDASDSRGAPSARREPGGSRPLLERAKSAELINRFARAVAAQLTVPGLLRVAVAKSLELCQAERVSVVVVDPNTGELSEQRPAAREKEMERRPVSSAGLLGRVACTATPRLVEKASACEDFEPLADSPDFQAGSLIAVPLLMGGDVLGVIAAARGEGREAFGQADLDHLKDFAPHLAIALHNALITAELRQAQSSLLQANAQLERKVEERGRQIAYVRAEWVRTIDAISDPIAVIEGCKVRRANRAYAAKIGMPVTQLAGHQCYELLARRTTPCPGCPMQSRRAGELFGELKLDDGTVFRYSGYRLSDDPNERAVVVHYRDVSAQRHLEEKQRELDRMVAIGQLAAGAAHEINNPLSFLSSNLNSLRELLEELRPVAEGEALQDGMAMVAESLEGARRVGEIVRRLGELARPAGNRSQPCWVNDCVSRAVRAVFGEDTSPVVLRLEANLPADISPLDLDDVLAHLLRNARQAISGSQKVAVTSFHTASEVRVEVSDEGCGIAGDHLPRVFEPFFTTRGIGKGLGLGLTAAYGIVRHAGGQLDVHSELGRGSTFAIRLPIAKAQQ